MNKKGYIISKETEGSGFSETVREFIDRDEAISYFDNMNYETEEHRYIKYMLDEYKYNNEMEEYEYIDTIKEIKV